MKIIIHCHFLFANKCNIGKNNLLFTLCFLSYQVLSQVELNLPTQRHCSFSGRAWEDELYSFPLNAKVQSWVNEILEAGVVDQNFQLIQANVENVAAIYDPSTGGRYLLFSQYFIEKAGTKLEVFSALAHEIGHHVCGHVLDPNYQKSEELEADEFMGYVLAKITGIASLESAQSIVDLLPTSHSKLVRPLERRMAIQVGWRRAEYFITINSASFDSNPDQEEFLLAGFPWPPPPCCSPIEIKRGYFWNASNLGHIAQKLCSALDANGYLYRRFLSIPKGKGFALVTQMEQYQPNFSCKMDGRWSTVPICESFQGFFDYFTRLVHQEKALFRVFVFLVTDKRYSIEGNQVSKEQAAAWSGKGIGRLPKSVADLPFSENMMVELLVYEFEVPKSNRRPQQKCPTIDTYKHLHYSGILDALGRN